MPGMRAWAGGACRALTLALTLALALACAACTTAGHLASRAAAREPGGGHPVITVGSFSLGRIHATASTGTTASALAASMTGRGLVTGRPAAAQDGNAIVVTAATAARYRLRTISDLARVESWVRAGGLIAAGRVDGAGGAP